MDHLQYARTHAETATDAALIAIAERLDTIAGRMEPSTDMAEAQLPETSTPATLTEEPPVGSMVTGLDRLRRDLGWRDHE